MTTDVVLPTAVTKRSDHALLTLVFATFGLLGLLFVVYVLSLVLEGKFHYSIFYNGWLPDGFEFFVSALCIGRAIVRVPGRPVAIALGLGLLSWCLGDIVLTFRLVYGSNALTNFLDPTFWLGFYPLTYLALILFMKGKLGALTTPNWLDGAVAALGTAAVCGAFAFHGLHNEAGASGLTKATNLAYPLGDLLLLALVVGGAAISGRRTTPWIVLAAACVLNCVGDTFNLFGSTQGPTRIDTIFHALAWPAAGLLMTIAIWLPAKPIDPFAQRKPTGLLLPGLAALAGLVVLIIGTATAVSRVALGLAIAALVVAGIRLMWSAQGLRTLTMQRHRQSMTDDLTGLGNRRHLAQILDTFFLEQSLENSAPRNLAFLFVDLDHFKEINDSFGHLAGDALLQQLGPRLHRSLGEFDVLVRVGGDEFGVALMDGDIAYAKSIAKQLSESLEEPFVIDGVSARIGASIGIATFPGDAENFSQLVECADVAMYRAKLQRLPFTVYDQQLDTDNQWRLGDELRQAIDEQQFVLYFQPQIELATGEITACETLVRWQHPKLGLLAPSRFLPLAEHAGLMRSLTALLLDDALAQGSAWHQAGHKLALSVNISASNLLDEGFVQFVRECLDRNQLPASALSLEITETSVIANFEKSQRIIEEISAMGVDVSIDDFGAGFTSLSYLSRLAVKELKLDISLISDLSVPDNQRGRDLVRSTIELGHALGLRVVAEGVEDDATLQILKELGSDFVQGFYIGRPVPASDFSFEVNLSDCLSRDGSTATARERSLQR